jgi:hypothetical protein
MGDINIAFSEQVHYDDHPPYYTVRIKATSIERQTDESRLTAVVELPPASPQHAKYVDTARGGKGYLY